VSALTALLAVTTGCTPAATPSADAPAATTAPSRTAAAQSALDRLALAARHGERRAFDSVVSDRDPAFGDRARELYTNLSQLPLDQLELRLQPGERELAAARRRLLGSDAWRQRAIVTWRLAGETTAAQHTVWLTFALHAGQPLLAGTIDAPGDARAPAPIWWTGPVRAVQEDGMSALLGAGQPAGLWSARVRTAVAEVRHRVSAGAAAHWSGTVVVEVPATRRDFEAVLGAAEGSYAGIAAATVAEGPAAAAVRVVVNPEVTPTLAPVGVAVVLLHELVHVATRSADSPAPTWMVEGLADYVALQAHPEAAPGAAEPLLRRVRSGDEPHVLPTDDRFRAGAPDLAVSYAEAWLLCRYIAEKFSPAALQRLYTALDSGTVLDQAVEDQLGVTRERLTAGWRRYLLNLAEA